MPILFIAHGAVGRRAVMRLGMLGIAVAPALEVVLEDAFAAVAEAPLAVEAAGSAIPPQRIRASAAAASDSGTPPVDQPPACASAVESAVSDDPDADASAADSSSAGARVADDLAARTPVAQAVACLLAVDARPSDDQRVLGQADGGGPFADASYVVVDLDDQTGAVAIESLVADYVTHELERSREPGLLLALDLRTADGATAARQLSEAVVAAASKIPEGFESRPAVVINILPDKPLAQHADLVEPEGWRSFVTLMLSDHTSDEKDRERLETDETLSELVAVLACAVENRETRDGLFAWTNNQDPFTGMRHAAVGVRAVVAGEDTTGKATQLALGMARTATQEHNERAPFGMEPVMTWPAEMGLDPGPLVGRILERPSSSGDSRDMRDAFGKPQQPAWTELDAGGWVISLRDLRRRSVLSPGMLLAERARANAEEWRVEILAKLRDLVDRVVEHAFLALPDAAFVLGEFDDAVSRATVKSELRHPAGSDFERTLGDLRAELEGFPHAEAMRTRFGLAGAAVAVPLALMLPDIFPGVPGIASRIAALFAGLVIGLVVALLYQRAREKQLIVLRDRALTSLGAWLIADIEKLVANEVARGVAQLREAMAEEHLPALDELVNSHAVAERALEVAAADVAPGHRIRSITELTGVKVPPRDEPDPPGELRRFMDEVPGRSGWRTLAPLDVGKRLLGHARAAVLPAQPDSLEAVMAQVLTGECRALAEKQVRDFLGGAETERALDPRRMPSIEWSQETHRVLLTSDVRAAAWSALGDGGEACTWDPERQMTVCLKVEWQESV